MEQKIQKETYEIPILTKEGTLRDITAGEISFIIEK